MISKALPHGSLITKNIRPSFRAVFTAAFVIFFTITAISAISAISAIEAFAMSTIPPASQSAVEVTPKSAASRREDMIIEGNMPVVSGLTSPKFQAELNALIRQEYTDKTDAAKKDSAKKLSFSYEFTPGGGEYYSIVIRSSTVAVSTRDEVRAFVFGSADKLLTVNDVLGPNGVKIINNVIADEMSKKPGTYNPDFAGITESQSFYVKDGSVFVVFDKYALGSAALGTPEFEINIDGVRNNTFTIGKDDSYPKDPYNVKMIPLRMVSSGLGFGLAWNPKELSIDVTRDSAVVASLSIGKNVYFKSKYPAYTLEFPPEIDENGVTYLPISFFERILDACYTVDQAGSITFSYYVAP